MRTYQDVVAAIRDGEPVSQEEINYALMFGHYFLMRFFFEAGKVVTTDPPETRGLKHLVDRMTNESQRDLDPYLRGSSMEPGISAEERRRRSTQSIAETATRLHDVLTKKS